MALDVLPAALGGRGEDSIAYFRGFEGIPESRIAGFATAERGEEIRNLMNEGVFVADTETRNPPFVEIGVVTITDMDAAPASDHALVRVIEILEAIEIVKIPPDGRIFAVDFERVEGLVSPGVTGRLKETKGPVGKVAVEEAGIVDGNRLFLPGRGVNAFLDKGFGYRGDITDAPVEPDRSVDTMSKQVAGHSRSGSRRIKAPQALSSLGKFFANGPVLEEVGPVVKNLTKLPGINDLLGKSDSWNPPIVIPCLLYTSDAADE